MKIELLRKPKIFIPAVLALALSVSSVAYVASRPPETSKQHQQAVQNTKQTTSVEPSQVKQESPTPSNTSVSTQIQTDPCKKTVTENTSNTGPNATNELHTDIQCESSGGSGTTSVNINNNSSQTASTGDSTGQSGTTSNSSTSDINVQIR